jgi:hypothetical protein
MHFNDCACVVWRHGALRCELWSVKGLGVLKVFDGSVLTRQESFQNGTWSPCPRIASTQHQRRGSSGSASGIVTLTADENA